MSGCILVYITNPDEETAVRVARHLLDKRLVACANIFPIKSLYWWKGEIAQEPECVLIVKTMPEQYDEVRHEVERVHPYTVPCVIGIDATANDKYFAWLRGEITHGG